MNSEQDHVLPTDTLPTDSKKMFVDIYRSKKEDGLYLYVERKTDLLTLPEALLHVFGKHELAMSLVLEPRRKLARADASTVITRIETQGYYLQMPSCQEADYMARLNLHNNKIAWNATS